MENNKKRITLTIAGHTITLVTDEPEEFVHLIADRLDMRISAFTKNSVRFSAMDAALLCAVESTGERLKADRRIRTLEAQAELYEVELKKLRAELAAAHPAPAVTKPEAETPHNEAETISNTLRGDDDSTAEDKIRALEHYLETKRNAPAGERSREEKIRYIESLLRGNREDGKKAE